MPHYLIFIGTARDSTPPHRLGWASGWPVPASDCSRPTAPRSS